jgi:hypothetical protein
MKYLYFLYISIFFLSCREVQIKQAAKNVTPILTPEELYKKITDKFDLIDSKSIAYDTVEKLNYQLVDTLLKYRESIFGLADTLNYDVIYVAKSKDKKLCLVSWDTRQGGTLIDYATVIFYKTKNEIKAQYLIDSNNNNTKIHYNDVYQLNANDQTYYLVRGFGQGSTALPWEQAVAYKIENDTILECEIFPELDESWSDNPSTPKMNSYLFVEFDLHYCEDNAERPICEFLNNNRTIRVPQTNDKGGYSNKYCELEFDGQKFEIKNSKARP